MENHVAGSGVTQKPHRSSTPAHTPGPWRFAKARTHIHIGGPVGDPSCGYVCRLQSREIDEANARLIAAAPDMLSALIEMQKLLVKTSLTQRDMDDLYHIAQDAIAKATGAAQ